MSQSAGKANSWSPGWDAVFATREWGRYPPEPIVRFVARHYYGSADRRAVRILDIGCGTGCVAWYMAREGFTVSGIDGSKIGLALARQRFRKEGLTGSFVRGDFTRKLPFPDASFDAAIDNAALCHNPPPALAAAIKEIHRTLKPGGRHFGMMFAPGSTGEGSGRLIAPNTYRGIKTGPLAGRWPVLFASRGQLRRLFSPFASLRVDRQSYTEGEGQIAVRHWLVLAEKAG